MRDRRSWHYWRGWRNGRFTNWLFNNKRLDNLRDGHSRRGDGRLDDGLLDDNLRDGRSWRCWRSGRNRRFDNWLFNYGLFDNKRLDDLRLSYWWLGNRRRSRTWRDRRDRRFSDRCSWRCRRGWRDRRFDHWLFNDKRLDNGRNGHGWRCRRVDNWRNRRGGRDGRFGNGLFDDNRLGDWCLDYGFFTNRRTVARSDRLRTRIGRSNKWLFDNKWLNNLRNRRSGCRWRDWRGKWRFNNWLFGNNYPNGGCLGDCRGARGWRLNHNRPWRRHVSCNTLQRKANRIYRRLVARHR